MITFVFEIILFYPPHTAHTPGLPPKDGGTGGVSAQGLLLNDSDAIFSKVRTHSF
jgi:hypothetical protein